MAPRVPEDTIKREAAGLSFTDPRLESRVKPHNQGSKQDDTTKTLDRIEPSDKNESSDLSSTKLSIENLQNAWRPFRHIPRLALPSCKLGPKGTSQKDRVTNDLKVHEDEIKDLLDCGDDTWVCRCPEHQHDARYNYFPRTGPVAIPTCAARCPYCEYKPGIKKDYATSQAGPIRKHIENIHAGKSGFYGLYVVSAELNNAWFSYKEPVRSGRRRWGPRS